MEVTLAQWALLPRGNIELCQLGTQFACYNHASGQTHLLNAFPAELLTLLDNQGQTIDEIAQQFSRVIEEPVTPEWVVKIERTLKDLEREGLCYQTLPTP